jgi:hypothetical protein
MLAIAMVAAGLIGGQAAVAQAPQRGPTEQAPSVAVNDKEIQAFAVASNEIQQLRQKWMPKVQEASQQGPDAQQKAEDQALGEMKGAVEKNGLTVEKYNQIAQAAQADPEIRQKIQKHSKPGK